VTPTACKRNVLVIHRRHGIVRAENLMRPAVAVLAVRRSRSARLHRLRMQAMRVGGLRVRMALRARHLQRRRVVDEALHILVAIHAGKHLPVNRMLHLRGIHIQTDRLAVDFRRQRRIGVTPETVFILELLLCRCGKCPTKQCGGKNRRNDLSRNFHGFEEMLLESHAQ